MAGPHARRQGGLQAGTPSSTASAPVVLTEDLAIAVAQRTTDFIAEFAPQTPYETWLVGEMALNTAKLDQCAEMMLVDYQRCIDRAELCWDLDRGISIDALGPACQGPRRVARAADNRSTAATSSSSTGRGSATCSRPGDAWDEPQRRLAFDLLGVPHELREATPGYRRRPTRRPWRGGGRGDDAAAGLPRGGAESTSTSRRAPWRRVGCRSRRTPRRRLRKYEARIVGRCNSAHAELRRVQARTAGDVLAADPQPVPCRPRSRRGRMRTVRLRTTWCGGCGTPPSAVRREYVEEPEAAAPPDPAPSPVLDPEPWIVSEAPPNAPADSDRRGLCPLLVAVAVAIAVGGATLSSLPLSPAPRNRRERLSLAKHSRQAARLGAR